MATTFLKPVKLPGIVLVQSRVVKREGRKVWVRGAIEDAHGESLPLRSSSYPLSGEKKSTDEVKGNLMAEAEAMLVDKAAPTPSDSKL